MNTTDKKLCPNQLRPHPRNISIYGDYDVSSLAELIRQSGWVKPLVVTPNHVIISGHRRWKAVCLLGWETVHIEVREFPDEIAELEALLLENASRTKTTEQKVREGFAWSEVEKEKARGRQRIAAWETNQKLGRDTEQTLPENFPEASKGETRDAIATRVGIGSGRTYSKAVKIVTQIDEEASLGHLEVAQALRKVLNEQSVDAAYTLVKKSPQERSCIAILIISGEAKSIKQAQQMVRQNHLAEFNDPRSVNYAGFSVGDWVLVNDNAHSKTYMGSSGQVEQILVVEQLLCVHLEGRNEKIRFYAHELTLIAKGTLPCPFQVEDIVFVDIDRHEAAEPQQKRWNGFWGKVTHIGEMGSLRVDVGCESLQLFPRDLRQLDAPSNELRQVVERVLRLRSLELDRIEEKMLEVIQQQEWFTPCQLDYLEVMEKFHFLADFYEPEKSQVVQH